MSSAAANTGVRGSIELPDANAELGSTSNRWDPFGFPLHDALALLPTSAARPLTKPSERQHREWAQYWFVVATLRGTRMPTALPRPNWWTLLLGWMLSGPA